MYQLLPLGSLRPSQQCFVLVGFFTGHVFSFNSFLEYREGPPGFKGGASDENAFILTEPMYTDKPLEQFSSMEPAQQQNTLNTLSAQHQNTFSSPDNVGFLTDHTNHVAQFGRDARSQPLAPLAGSISSLPQIGISLNRELQNYGRISSLDSKHIAQRPGVYSTAASVDVPHTAHFGLSAGNNFQQQAPSYTGPGQESFSPQTALQGQQDVSGMLLASSPSPSKVNQLVARIKSNQAMQYARQGQLSDESHQGMAWNAQQDFQRKAATQLVLHDLHSAVEGLVQDVNQLDRLLGQGQLGDPSTVQQVVAVQTGSRVRQFASTTTTTSSQPKHQQLFERYFPYVIAGCIAGILFLVGVWLIRKGPPEFFLLG